VRDEYKEEAVVCGFCTRRMDLGATRDANRPVTSTDA
jgi:hypothetical protein